MKLAITREPNLRNFDFRKEFIFYTYGFNSSITAVLTRKFEKNEDCSIAFLVKL